MSREVAEVSIGAWTEDNAGYLGTRLESRIASTRCVGPPTIARHVLRSAFRSYPFTVVHDVPVPLRIAILDGHETLQRWRSRKMESRGRSRCGHDYKVITSEIEFKITKFMRAKTNRNTRSRVTRRIPWRCTKGSALTKV